MSVISVVVIFFLTRCFHYPGIEAFGISLQLAGLHTASRPLQDFAILFTATTVLQLFSMISRMVLLARSFLEEVWLSKSSMSVCLTQRHASGLVSLHLTHEQGCVQSYFHGLSSTAFLTSGIFAVWEHSSSRRSASALL